MEWRLALAIFLWQSGKVRVRKILLIDDDPQLLRLLEKHLQRLGFAVEAQAAALAALAQLEKAANEFDLVVTDQNLPDLAADKLLARIVEIRPELPVLICSGSEFFISGLPAHLQPHVGFLQKPFPPKELVAAIERLLAGSTQTPPPED